MSKVVVNNPRRTIQKIHVSELKVGNQFSYTGLIPMREVTTISSNIITYKFLYKGAVKTGAIDLRIEDYNVFLH